MKRQPTEAQKTQAKERRDCFRSIVKRIAAMPEADREALSKKVLAANVETEIIPYQKINSLAKRIEKANLKRLRTSPTWGTIANTINSLILEVRSDPCVVLIRKDWRAVMKQRGTL